MGGKRQANILSAIIQNFDIVEDAIQTSAESAGSALEENEKYLNSIQGRIDLFNNAVQTMWSNTLDSDVVKGFVNFGTILVKLVDNVGLLRIAFMGLGVYLMKRFNIGDIIKPGTNSLEQMRKTLASLKEDAQKANADDLRLRTEKSARKKETANKRVEDYEAQIKPYEEVNALKEKQNELIARQAEAQATVNKANHDFIVATREGADPTTLEAYGNSAKQAKIELETINMELDATNAKLTTVGVSAETTGKKGAVAFKNFGNKLKSFGKQLGKIAIQMLAMYALTAVLELISKGFEAIKTAIDDAIETPEEAKEKFEQLNNELSQCQSELRSLESEFKTLQEQIDELNSQGSLSFSDEQELERLQKESAELERQITMKKVLQNNLQKETNAAAVNSTNKYLAETSFGSKESKSERQEKAKETGETIGTAAGLAIGAALAIAIPGVGLMLGAAIAGAGSLAGKYIGGAIGEAVEGSAYDSEQSVGKAIDNMVEDRAKLQKKVDEAFANKDTDAYNKAVEDLNSYDSMMAQHMSEIQAAVNAIDYETATNEQKKQVDLWNDLLDKYAITMGTAGAKENAINRILGLDKFQGVAHNINLVKDQLEAETISSEDADAQIQQLIKSCPELEKKLIDLGISVKDTSDLFVKLGNAAAEAKGKLSSALTPLSNIEKSLKSLGDAFDEFDENGIVTASTLADLYEQFGNIDGFEDFIAVLGNSSSTTQEVTDAISDMASAYLMQSGILSDITEENKAFVISQLKALGVINPEEYLDDISAIHDAMATEYGVDLSNYGTVQEMKQAIAGSLYQDIMSIQGDTLDDLAKNYGYDLSNFASVEEAKTYIAAEEAKKRAKLNKDNATYESDAAAIRDGTVLAKDEIETAFGIDIYGTGKTYTEVKKLYEKGWYGDSFDVKQKVKAWLDSVEDAYDEAVQSGKEAADQTYNDTIANIDNAYNQLSSLDEYIARYNPTLSFDIPGLGGGEDPEKTKEKEANDAFQEAMDYWENRISANQAKYEQIQNEIDLIEKKGGKAGKEYYEEQIRLEEERLSLLDNQKQAAQTYLSTLQEGSDEWWEAANTLNDIESKIDDVTASLQDLSDAIAEIDLYVFEETHNRFKNLIDDLETIRDLIAPNGEEDWFDDEGMWTEKGVAVIGTYIEQYAYYKELLADVNEELAKYQKEYAGNEAYYAQLGIDSEQELYDKQRELIDQQYEYAQAVNDTENSVKDAYSAQINAIEEWADEAIDAYNDYINVVKESLSAERDLYEFKKSTNEKTKNIASLERRIASLSASDNASDIAERRKLQAELADAKMDLEDHYYSHAKDQQSQALDDEAQAYEESLNNYIEKLRDTLDEATANMELFMQSVTNSVMINAQIVKDEYTNTGVVLDEALVTPWNKAIEQIKGFETNGLSMMNAWTTEEGFFGQFESNATGQLSSPWSAGTNAANAFKNDVKTAMDKVVEDIKTNVSTAKGELADLYAEIQSTNVKLNNVTSNPNPDPEPDPDPKPDTDPKPKIKASSQDIKMLQEILRTVFGMNITSNGVYDEKTQSAVKMMQQQLKDIGLYEKSIDGKYGSGTKDALKQYVNSNIRQVSLPVDKREKWFNGKAVSFFRNRSSYIPSAFYAKGTTATKKDQWAIDSEPQFGDELVLVPTSAGNLSYMRKGTGVVPATLTKEIMDIANVGLDGLMNANKFGTNINMISNAINKPELNLSFDSLVHVDNCSQDTLKDLEKMVDTKINQFSRNLNYALKRVGGK